MENRIFYVLGMLRSIVRGTDRMCSKGRCIRNTNLAEHLMYTSLIIH